MVFSDKLGQVKQFSDDMLLFNAQVTLSFTFFCFRELKHNYSILYFLVLLKF